MTQHTNLKPIAMLWLGPELSFLEQLCMQSYLDAGHEVRLYCYDDVANIPSGVIVKDGREVIENLPLRIHARTGSPALSADFFRFVLLQKQDVIWSDTDAYCVRPYHFNTPYIFGALEGQIGIGVLALPQNSPALARLVAFAQEPAPPVRIDMIRRIITPDPKAPQIPVEQLPWAATGPWALEHFLKETGEIAHIMPEHRFYPLDFDHRNKLIRPQKRPEVEQLIDEDCYSIHFYARRMRPTLAEKSDGLPRKRSYLAMLCDKHGIDPKAAPVRLHNFLET